MTVDYTKETGKYMQTSAYLMVNCHQTEVVTEYSEAGARSQM